jgi:hypothetical protein
MCVGHFQPNPVCFSSNPFYSIFLEKNAKIFFHFCFEQSHFKQILSILSKNGKDFWGFSSRPGANVVKLFCP